MHTAKEGRTIERALGLYVCLRRRLLIAHEMGECLSRGHFFGESRIAEMPDVGRKLAHAFDYDMRRPGCMTSCVDVGYVHNSRSGVADGRAWWNNLLTPFFRVDEVAW